MSEEQKIIGYTNQSEIALETINGLKRLEIEMLNEFLSWFHPNQKFDPRWKAIAQTHFQEGFMAAIRCIAKPNGEI